MPSSAPPPDRHAVESALPPAVLAGLAELCELLDVPRDGWHLRPALARVFETAAWRALVERFEAEGDTGEGARMRAAIRLGMESEETAISRVKRWRRAG